LGKYFYSIPTYLKFPKTYGYGLLQIKKTVTLNKLSDSFINDLYLELYNLRFHPKKSLALKKRREKMLLVLKNKTYSHYRWS